VPVKTEEQPGRFALGSGAYTDPIPDSPMVPAIGARWPPCRGESGMGIKALGVVARGRIELPTRGFSVPYKSISY